jgi:hypothetical protein
MDHTALGSTTGTGPRSIGRPAWAVLGTLLTTMAVIGGFGAYGTFTNMSSKFETGTALGVTAAGEGLAAVIALAILGFTLLQQPAPRTMHVGLWLLPAMASGTGMLVADTGKEMAVYAMTPMAMSVSGEAIAAIARNIVIRTTGIDIETQRRNTETARMFAYHAARSQRHPVQKKRDKSQNKMWKIAKKVGKGDLALANALTTAYRDQVGMGADQALLALFSGTAPALEMAPETQMETTFPQAAEPVAPTVEAPFEVPVETPDPRKEMAVPAAETVVLVKETPAPKPVLAERVVPKQMTTMRIQDVPPAFTTKNGVTNLSEAQLRQLHFAELWYKAKETDPEITQADFARTMKIRPPYLSRALTKFPKAA